MNKLLQEMQSILGHEITALPSHDPTPRDVVGTFAVQQSASIIDEAVWQSISEHSWDSVIDYALLYTVNYSNFNKLKESFAESSSKFRETWKDLVDEGEIHPAVSRGAFLSVIKMVERSDAQAKFVYWCARAIGEASSKVKAKVTAKVGKFNGIFPGNGAADHAKGVEAAQRYMTPHNSEVDRPEASQEVMRNAVFHGQDDSKAPLPEMPKDQGMEQVIKAQDMLSKVASDHGMAIDRAFPQLFSLLARERVRNS